MFLFGRRDSKLPTRCGCEALGQWWPIVNLVVHVKFKSNWAPHTLSNPTGSSTCGCQPQMPNSGSLGIVFLFLFSNVLNMELNSYDHILCRRQYGVEGPWELPGYSRGTSGNQKLETLSQEVGSGFQVSPAQWTSGLPVGTRCFGVQAEKKGGDSEISSF